MLIFLDFFGTIVFAITGVMVANRSEMDIFGALVLATVTAIGGGTIRDILLGLEPFWMKNVVYLYVIAATTLLAFFLIKWIEKIPPKSLEIADAIGLATFTITGISVARTFHTSETVCVMMGIITAVAGGAARDVLSNRIPIVLNGRGFYATASLIGGALGLSLQNIVSLPVVYTVIGGTTLLLRLLSIHNLLFVPTFKKGND